MKLKLEQSCALDRAGLHVLDSGEVQEVVLVEVGEVTFHLGGVHAPVRLSDVEGGDAKRGKDVLRHLLNREPSAEQERDHQHDDGDGPSQR